MPKTIRTVAAKSAAGNDGLWDFACALYAKPGVAQACLALQEECGADVPLLLAALWHGATGRGSLVAARARRWKTLARSWREQIVAPLREARRALKTQEAAEAAALYAAVKRAELAAEKLQLEALERDAAAREPRAKRVRGADARTNACRVLQRGSDSVHMRKIFSALREAP